MTTLCNIHVLHIVSGDLWAGAEVQLFTLAKGQQRQPETHVSVVILNHGMLEQQLKQAGIDTIVIDESKLNGIEILLRLIRIIRALRPDVIHTHRNKENILGSIAARLSGNIPTLRTAHGSPEHKSAWYQIHKRTTLFLDWFCGRFLQKSIIAVSEDLADILAKDYPVQKIHVIQNGIDAVEISRSASEQSRADTIKTDVLRIGIIGRLVPVKRVDLFIRAAHRLIDEFPELNPSFHIYGDGPLRDELEALNRTFKTHTRIHFEGHCHTIHAQIKNLDVLLMTSDHEGLPMTLLEAMALRTPIIAHAVGGIPKLLDEGNCGLLVYTQAPSEYVRAIIALKNMPEKFTAMIDSASYQVKVHYSASNNSQEYRDKYKSIISTE
jgi:glycosyltransferase involved in cell wall biosynthesis